METVPRGKGKTKETFLIIADGRLIRNVPFSAPSVGVTVRATAAVKCPVPHNQKSTAEFVKKHGY